MTTETPTPQNTAEREQMIALAAQVQNNKHLRIVIKAANPALRRLVYDQIAPHLSFKAKPFFLLVK